MVGRNTDFESHIADLLVSLADKIRADQVPLAIDGQGVIRIGKTRVTLDLVVEAFDAGAQPAEIVEQYPALVVGDVELALGFYLQHRAEVSAYLEERRKQAEEVRRQNEARWPADGLRERLQARRDSKAE